MTGTFAGAALTGTWPDYGERVLAVVGVGEDAERLYTMLVRRGRASVAELARAAGRPSTQVAAILAELDELGLANEAGGGRWRAASPEIAVEALVLRREEQLAAARRVAARLQEQFRTVLADDQMAEVVRGTEEVRRRLVHAGATASRELWVLERPPLHLADGVLAATGTPPPPLLRVLYDAEGFAASGLWRREPLAASTRLFPDLPFSLVVGDGLGVVPMLDGSPQALVVSPSPLLEVLRLVADTLWRAGMAVPERTAPDCPAGPSEDDRQLLTLLSAGLSDRAIARELNLSVRTVERRMRRLLESLGVRTRFQAAVQAVHKGWL
jgi:DNA-binding CsgD family transcriptional regulator